MRESKRYESNEQIHIPTKLTGEKNTKFIGNKYINMKQNYCYRKTKDINTDNKILLENSQENKKYESN